MTGKKLCKSNDKKLCGVCAGIAEYFGLDPAVVRLVYALLVLFTGIGILPYIIAAIIMDEAPADGTAHEEPADKRNSAYNANESDEVIGFKPGADNNEVKGFKL